MIYGNFKDGPAVGEILSFERNPGMLRVVLDGDKVDVLDQLDDEPSESEQIFVYARGGTTGHICARGRGSGPSGWMIDYRFVPLEDTERFRDTATWRAWCEEIAAWVKANAPSVAGLIEHLREGTRAES